MILFTGFVGWRVSLRLKHMRDSGEASASWMWVIWGIFVYCSWGYCALKSGTTCNADAVTADDGHSDDSLSSSRGPRSFAGKSGQCVTLSICKGTFTSSAQDATGCESFPHAIKCCTRSDDQFATADDGHSDDEVHASCTTTSAYT